MICDDLNINRWLFIRYSYDNRLLKPGFHIVVSDGDASQSMDRRCCWDAYDDMGTLFGDVTDVPVEIWKIQPSSTFGNVLDASPSCLRRCWDVPVAYDDMETRLKFQYPSTRRVRTPNITFNNLYHMNERRHWKFLKWPQISEPTRVIRMKMFLQRMYGQT